MMEMTRIDHIAFVVKNIDKVAKFYMDVFGCKNPKIFEMDKPSFKVKYALLPIGQNYIELIEPKNGALKDILETKGEGYIYEICFGVDDIERFCDEMKERGIVLVDIDGILLTDRKFLIAPSGNKYVYLSRKNTFGTRIEVLERVAKDDSHQTKCRYINTRGAR